MIPSLNINITEKCNFNCCYCPEYGESIIHEKSLCDVNSVVFLVNIAKKCGLNILRLTGGEPLLEINRVKTFVKTAIDAYYSKIILNTNGFFLVDAHPILKQFKEYITLKVSLDTVNPHTFTNITSVNGLDRILDGIEKYLTTGFEVSLNLVISTLNINDIESVIKYAEDKNLNLKILGLSSFGGHVDISNLYVPLREVTSFLDSKYNKLKAEYLPGNSGKPMDTYLLDCGKHILVVDHSNNSNNQYVEDCLNCEYYPCSFGRLHISLTAGGSLRGCRLRNDDSISISNQKEDIINSSFLKVLGEFDKPIEVVI